MKKIISSALISLLLSTVIYSQENIRSILQDTINLDEVVVTGTTVKVNKRNVPMAVSVVNSKQIQESNETALLHVLNGRVPGLFVTERGIMGFGVSNGAAGQISIRGIGGSPTTGVLMLIDGHPQFTGLFGHPLPDSYVASDVEKVEVIRGPASILYGTNAMGGVINIITKKQTDDGFNGNAHVMYGSYNTQKYMASGGYKKDKFTVFASINNDKTDGHRANSDFSIKNGYIKLGYELNKNLQISTDFSLAQFDATDPGPDTINANPGYNLDITRGYWAMTVNNNYEKYSGNLKLFYNFGKHIISDGFLSTDNNWGLNFSESFRLFKGNNLTLGADYLTYGGVAENEKFNVFITDTSIYDAGVYGFMQQSLFEKLILNAGLRVQNHQVYGTELIPSGGFAWKPLDNTTWKTSISKGFRSPTIRELFLWNHNLNLSPESIMSYETGVHQSLYGKKVSIEITGFIVKGDNMIVNVPTVGLLNAGEVNNKGIELAASSAFSDKLSSNLTYSFTHMEHPVYATPKHNLFLSSSYQLKKVKIMASLQHINDLDSDPSTAIESFESYTLLNSKISYQALKFAELFISAENILNQEYETNRYYTMPGITVFGGIKLKL
jgi:iron complex outermembrane receptor protein